jgi:hypothetical protein
MYDPSSGFFTNSPTGAASGMNTLPGTSTAFWEPPDPFMTDLSQFDFSL